MPISDGWQMDVQTEFALQIYKQFWPDCEVVENDALGADEEVAQILDFGDVDKIIRMPGKQIHMAQRFRKPYFSKRRDEWVDPDFTLRYSRPVSDNVIEYQRLMDAYETGAAAYPRRYSFGRVYNDAERGLYELYILDTDRLIEAIKTDRIEENGPITNREGQDFVAYDVDEIVDAGIVVKSWKEQSTPQPDDPSDIREWCSTGGES